ncbi:hypothetical protein [Pseudonocardia nigra]|uniref:hypothetical protein n=1 Tax=Pseudonocardia nigra TaxID=1921578 RepID=UPI001C5F69CC|nr:hypothetical protein [Pseudonocardia nigra]
MDARTPGLHLRSRLLALGLTSDEVQRGRRAGDLVTIRRGAYLRADDERLSKPAARHAMLVRATVPTLAPDAVASHGSAAVLHGLAVWGLPLDCVHVTRAAASGGRIGRVVHRHKAPLEADEITTVDGIAVTTPARTVVDIARSAAFEHALVVADSGLAIRRVDPHDLAVALARAARWPGIPQARRVVAFADGGAMSVGETRSRLAIMRAGLPQPVLQWRVPLADDADAYTDFAWPAVRTVGEFDGLVKYGRLVPAGQTAGDVITAEKIREDAIRSHGFTVVRWIWSELDDFAPVARRLERAFALGE